MPYCSVHVVASISEVPLMYPLRRYHTTPARPHTDTSLDLLSSRIRTSRAYVQCGAASHVIMSEVPLMGPSTLSHDTCSLHLTYSTRREQSLGPAVRVLASGPVGAALSLWLYNRPSVSCSHTCALPA